MKKTNNHQYNDFLHSILRALSEQVAVIDQDGFLVVVNDAWVRFAQENDGDLTSCTGKGINYLSVCDQAIASGDNSAQLVKDGIVSVINKDSQSFECDYPCDSPFQKRWFRMHASPIDYENGGVVISHFEITHLINKQEELLTTTSKLEVSLNESNMHLDNETKRFRNTFDSLQRFRFALDASHDAIYLIDPKKHRFIDSNKSGWELLGYSRDELLLIGPSDIKPLISKQELNEYFDQVCNREKDEVVLQTQHQRKDESNFPVEIRLSAVNISGSKLIIAIARDITEKQAANKALYESNERFRMLFDCIPLGVALADRNGRYTMVNQAMVDMMGYSQSELITGMTFHDITYEEDLADNLELIANLYDSKADGFSLDKRYRTKNGLIILVNIVVRVIKDNYGIPTHTLGIHQDITEKRMAENTIKTSAATIRALIDAPTNEYFLLFDSNDNIVELNEAAANQLNETVSNLRGRNIQELFEPDVIKRRVGWGDIVKHKKTPMNFQDERNGRIFDFNIYPVLDENSNVIRSAVFGRDITELKRQAELKVAQEIEHRDTLVREVHHRIKNNLQSVAGLLRRQRRMHPENFEVINEAIGQVEAIAIVYGIQNYANENTQLDLEAMLNNIASANLSLYGSHVSINLANKLDGNFIVHQDEAVPLALVFNELITNALKHSYQPLEADIDITVDRHGNDVLIAVSNHGYLPTGFDMEKGKGLGTGLNLVNSLLPSDKYDFSLNVEGDNVVAQLRFNIKTVSNTH